MSTTPTPADLDVLAERWCRQRGIDSTWEHQSLAALLRSVREEGARQERKRWQRACEEERGLAERMLREGRPDHLAWSGRVACVGDILDTVADESPTP